MKTNLTFLAAALLLSSCQTHQAVPGQEPCPACGDLPYVTLADNAIDTCLRASAKARISRIWHGHRGVEKRTLAGSELRQLKEDLRHPTVHQPHESAPDCRVTVDFFRANGKSLLSLREDCRGCCSAETPHTALPACLIHLLGKYLPKPGIDHPAKP